MEVFKHHNDLPTRWSLKVKTTILVVLVFVRVTFCSNILLGVSHSPGNVTASNV